MRRWSQLAVAGALVVALLPALASAALLQWTLVMTPLTTTVTASTSFSLTATNLLMLNDLGCLEVDVPASFVIESLGMPVASNNDPWTATRTGNAVIVQSQSGGGRLGPTESVQFTIQAHATQSGSYLWPNHAHRAQDCSTTDQAGVPLSVTVLPALLLTPTPTPSPTPTATPTATPIALPSLPVPLPSIGIGLPTPTPAPTSTPNPSATRSPREERTTPTPQPSGATGAGGSSGSGGGSGGSGGSGATTALQVVRGRDDPDAGAGIGLELGGVLHADFSWFVPAAPVAVPGLLVILFVILQAVGGLAWIPAVRRMGNEEERR